MNLREKPQKYVIIAKWWPSALSADFAPGNTDEYGPTERVFAELTDAQVIAMIRKHGRALIGPTEQDYRPRGAPTDGTPYIFFYEQLRLSYANAPFRRRRAAGCV